MRGLRSCLQSPKPQLDGNNKPEIRSWRVAGKGFAPSSFRCEFVTILSSLTK